MCIRIKQGSSADERITQLVTLFSVLEFLVVPVECYHSFLEHYFEVVRDDNKQSCGAFCTYCCSGHLHFPGRFYQEALECVITTAVLAKGGQLHWKEFIKVLKVRKTDISHESDMPSTFMGPIHALTMQLLAKGIIELKVPDRTKVGTNDLNDKHIVVSLTDNSCAAEN